MKVVTGNGLTPVEFKNRFLKLKLEDFVTIGNFPMYNKEFNKVYRLKYEGNVRQAYARYLNLPIEDLKSLVVKQLKDGVPVYMGAHIIKFRDTQSGVLDIRLYDYADTLNFETLTKEEALNLRDICIMLWLLLVLIWLMVFLKDGRLRIVMATRLRLKAVM